MSAIIIKDCAPWDGRYEFDDFSFTNRELYEIKQLSGIRAGELIEALEANDTSAYVGVALVVMKRHGLRLEADSLWNAKVGSITLDLSGSDEGDAVPPPTAPAERPESESGGSGPDSTSGGD